MFDHSHSDRPNTAHAYHWPLGVALGLGLAASQLACATGAEIATIITRAQLPPHPGPPVRRQVQEYADAARADAEASPRRRPPA